jgi:3-oxoacyl-[acyl-carrier-protein] synthase-3
MIYLHGLGHFHPPTVIDNAFLTGLNIGTDEAWILERVGIRTRRTVLPLEYLTATQNADPLQSHAVSTHTNAQTGAEAARLAMARAGVTADQIGLVWAGGCSPQHTIPAEACKVAAELGIRAPGVDVTSACSTFAAQLHLLDQMKPEALPAYVLLLQIENNTRTVDYRDRSTAVLWGDASAAAVVSTRNPARVKVMATTLTSDPSGWDKVLVPTGGHFAQQGSAVQTFAIRKSGEVIQTLRAQVKGDPSRLRFVGHQANLLMLQAVAARAGIPDDRHWWNVDRFGNGGAAGAPSVLSQHWDELQDGDELVVAVVGSGLTWGGVLLQVGEIA